MKPITHKEAVKKECPINNFEHCIGEKCMAWKEINPRIEREDHSGGREMIAEQRSKRGYQEIKREGPPGSTGVLILESQGICELVDKEKK